MARLLWYELIRSFNLSTIHVSIHVNSFCQKKTLRPSKSIVSTNFVQKTPETTRKFYQKSQKRPESRSIFGHYPKAWPCSVSRHLFPFSVKNERFSVKNDRFDQNDRFAATCLTIVALAKDHCIFCLEMVSNTVARPESPRLEQSESHNRLPARAKHAFTPFIPKYACTILSSRKHTVCLLWRMWSDRCGRVVLGGSRGARPKTDVCMLLRVRQHWPAGVVLASALFRQK